MDAAQLTARLDGYPARVAAKDQTNICPLVVAVDGPSGSGKSSVSRGAAAQLEWRYLDTGAMYRAMAVALMRAKVDVSDPEAVSELIARTEVSSTTDPADPKVWLDGEDVSVEIRSSEVTAFVSQVSAVPEVRMRMADMQRRHAQDARDAGTGIIVEGRDIGTTVLPHADLKVFLTADTNARAVRRAEQDTTEGRSATVASTQQALIDRDKADSARKLSPLTKAPDAVEIDASDIDLPGVIQLLLSLIAERSAQCPDTT